MTSTPCKINFHNYKNVECAPGKNHVPNYVTISDYQMFFGLCKGLRLDASSVRRLWYNSRLCQKDLLDYVRE